MSDELSTELADSALADHCARLQIIFTYLLTNTTVTSPLVYILCFLCLRSINFF